MSDAAINRDWRVEASERKTCIAATLAEMGLSIQSTFVPFSVSRNAGEKRTLNWKIALMKGAREILRCDYSAGEAHAPSYKQGDRSMDRHKAISVECETGFAQKRISEHSAFYATRKPITPEPINVIHSIVMDSEVLEHATYESWARDCGYDVDSRKGEAIYRACLSHALALRAALGDTGLSQLREAFQDY